MSWQRSTSPRIRVLSLALGAAITFLIYWKWGSRDAANELNWRKSRGIFRWHQPRYAFATYLSGVDAHWYPVNTTSWSVTKEDTDGYFLSARMLNYMLRYHPVTKTRQDIPFIVLADDTLEEYKKARLEAEGAIVIEAPVIPMPEGNENKHMARWANMFSKLWLWKLTGFEKIAFVDADMIVLDNLDGIFSDPKTDLQRTDNTKDGFFVHNEKGETVPRPATYMFAGGPDAGPGHSTPPSTNNPQINGGFFVLTPSDEIFDYYMSGSHTPASANDGKPLIGKMNEQDLFNNLHKLGGPMPWQPLDWHWTVNFGNMRDVAAGVKTVHQKYWTRNPEDPEIFTIWLQQRWELEGFWISRGLPESTAPES